MDLLTCQYPGSAPLGMVKLVAKLIPPTWAFPKLLSSPDNQMGMTVLPEGLVSWVLTYWTSSSLLRIRTEHVTLWSSNMVFTMEGVHAKEVITLSGLVGSPAMGLDPEPKPKLKAVCDGLTQVARTKALATAPQGMRGAMCPVRKGYDKEARHGIV